MDTPVYFMSGNERKDIMAAMSDNFDTQDDPKVGIFWYDSAEDELFGITSAYADELSFNSNGKKTERTLHKAWWKKQQERAKAKGQALGRLAGDYTQTPRGRVFQIKEDGRFELMCGSWINNHIIDLVKEEFNLQNVPLKIIIDSHWEIGHGWSEEFD
jgi:hypothetical protein